MSRMRPLPGAVRAWLRELAGGQLAASAWAASAVPDSRQVS